MYLLGYDIGNISVKAVLVETQSGRVVAQAEHPRLGMETTSPKPEWAEQDPNLWWENLQTATADVMRQACAQKEDVQAIGLCYATNGLIVVDKAGIPLRPCIIANDSRATAYGYKALKELGEDYFRGHLLNSPVNLTATRLAWIKENEPEVFGQIFRFMLPGDYVVFRLTGEMTTTQGGLSEAGLWDFYENSIANRLIDHLGIDPTTPCDVVNTFGWQGSLTRTAAEDLGLKEGTPIGFRAGEQPTNAFALGVNEPGLTAASADDWAMVYAVTDKLMCDPKMQLNTVSHVNYYAEEPRLGVQLCVGGAGQVSRWTRLQEHHLDGKIPNGTETPCDTERLSHAAMKSIASALAFGIEDMRDLGLKIKKIRAPKSGLFQSKLFCQAVSEAARVKLDICDTNGAVGAALGAGIGLGIRDLKL